MKLTITQVENHDKKKDGTPITDNKGRPKFRYSIKAVEKGNEYLTGFGYKPLNVGEVIEAEVSTKEYMGKSQLNFEIKAAGKEMAQAGEHTSAVLSEMKTHTVLLKDIVDKLESIYMSISTHQTIEAIKSKKRPEAATHDSVVDIAPAGPLEASESAGPEDYGFTAEDFPQF